MAGEPVTAVEDLDGVKLVFGERGWLLHRLSGTEPIIRVYAEHEDPAVVEKLLAETEADLRGAPAEALSRGTLRPGLRVYGPREEAPMKRSRTSLVSVAAALVFLAPGAARASGSSSMPRGPQAPTPSPEQEAASLLQRRHLVSRQGGEVREGSRRGEGPDKAEKLLGKAKDRHESSIKPFGPR